MDMAHTYRELKIIAIGAVDTARQVVQYDSEMRNRVAEIHIPLMVEDEIKEIILKGEECLNVSFPDTLKNDIVHYSSGLASVCHTLCLNTCRNAGVERTVPQKVVFKKTEFESGIKDYIEDAADTVKDKFNRAFKKKNRTTFDNAKLIIYSLSILDSIGATRSSILEEIRKIEPTYPVSNFKYSIDKLQTEEYGQIIRYDNSSSLYSFSDPIYRVYASAFFKANLIKPDVLHESTASLLIENHLLKYFSKIVS
jgi:hypothetical protein